MEASLEFDRLETALVEAKALAYSIITALTHPNATTDFEVEVSSIRNGFNLIENGFDSLRKRMDGNKKDSKTLEEIFPEVCARCEH